MENPTILMTLIQDDSGVVGFVVGDDLAGLCREIFHINVYPVLNCYKDMTALFLG